MKFIEILTEQYESIIEHFIGGGIRVQIDDYLQAEGMLCPNVLCAGLLMVPKKKCALSDFDNYVQCSVCDVFVLAERKKPEFPE